jgi:DNA-binding transcriptional MerR regulator
MHPEVCPAMPRKIISGSQLPLFPEDLFYVSQKDAAAHLEVSTRTINYWESMELLHPELMKHKSGKGRKYTPNDMIELKFIKGMVVDQGYAIPSLKEKLAKLPSPYYYDPNDLFWDIREEQWKTRDSLASHVIKKQEKKIKDGFARLYEKFDLPGDSSKKEQFLSALMEILRNTPGKGQI